MTETYVALRLEVDNWRWAGVPIYLRTGKRLARKVTEIAVTLKPVPHLAFDQEGSVGVQPNQIVLGVQPNEGVTISLGAKIPGRTTLCTMLSHWTPSDPDWTRAAPISPPISACEELDGNPSHHVIRFHVIAPKSAARTVLSVARPVSMIPFPTGSRDESAGEVGQRCDQDREARRERPRRDGRRDCVSGVVEPVREVEGERDDHHDDEERVAQRFLTKIASRTSAAFSQASTASSSCS